mmetsp:Transcript_28643/g.66401  ORF Transcript_28643/g.66401 Transcript_28643/m.66401 type:complete len:895 (-) Transcript_28643:123-2807(-)|eukprot:CAMPEP_0178387058 /NCGR_PEP_ID=MMETSP0689_2-20121128/8880_1 /TAXON_ID=160604 /ORGANISM="Amphidinium massartii, Strain CS-259" /LENGTH=894 /DNA_ID=CAMNT_0020007415 /DNA_START=30 /DNA_END=2714 /DNA_ORIENTATION=+
MASIASASQAEPIKTHSMNTSITQRAAKVADRLSANRPAAEAAVKISKGSLRRGEVECPFWGGHRYHYIISDEATESPDAILQWMFTDPNGWRMKAPSLILSAFGGRDHFVNWYNSIHNRDEWGTHVDYELRAKLQNRMSEIAGGISQAVTECGGWIDFGTGIRGGMNEVIAEGLKTYWSGTGDLAGFKTSTTVMALRSLADTQYAEKFLECSIPVGSVDGTSKAGDVRLEKRVIYPDVAEMLFPELFPGETHNVEEAQAAVEAEEEGQSAPAAPDGDDAASVASPTSQTPWYKKEVRFTLQRRYISPAMTHLIFVNNPQCLAALRVKLFSLSTRATLLANGPQHLIRPGAEGKILHSASSGIPVIILNNTGGAAETLGNAVLQKRGAKSQQHSDNPNTYTLPENIPDEQFLILNPARDSVEKVINKLTLVLSTVQDDEMMEVGYAKGEKARLAYAWELYAQFKYNAAYYQRFARRLHYTVTLLAVLITLISVVSQAKSKSSGSGHGGDSDAAEEEELQQLALADKIVAAFNLSHHFELKILLLLLPAISGFFLTMQSKFNPLGKWASLESGAVQLRSEIYQYRCRVAEYMPRKSNVQGDIEERIMDMLDAAPVITDAASQEAARKRKKRLEKEGKTKMLSRRGQFSQELERIHSEATGGDMHGDSLTAPPPEEVAKVHDSLFDSIKLKRQQQGGLARTLVCSPCAESPGNYSILRSQDGWEGLGGDYIVNFEMIEDDFLRDDGLGLITAEDYVHFRMLPMLRYYNDLAPRLGRKTQALQVISFLLTAFLTAAAALGWEMWVPFVVAVLQAVVSTLAFENYVVQLRNVNQSLEALKNLRVWWQSLSMVERRMPASKEVLVKGVESTVDAEISAFKKSLKSMTKGGGANGEKEEE